tara:strand:- start:394 stop:1767 length:1374 start_codon:yes stop_codon:yes gene_type:complete
MTDKNHWFVENLKNYSNQQALAFNNIDYTYGELLDQIENYDKELKEIVEVGSIVALVSDYSFYSISIFLCLLKKKCIIVPITSTIEEDIKLKIYESNSDIVITIKDDGLYNLNQNENKSSKNNLNLIENLRKNKNAGLILFSSGSTGKPKAMLQNLENLCKVHKGKRPKPIVMMIFLMFDHIGGINTLLGSLMIGGVMVIPSKRDPDHVSKLIERYKVKVLPASPTFLNLLLISESHNKYDLSSLRMITYGTESMPESLLHKLRSSFKRAKFLQTFGTSETGIAQMKSKSSDSTFMKFDDPNLEHKIIEGKLFLRSNTQISGYLNSSMESFDEDGWFDTGDLAEETDDGFIKIIGRSKEIINVGGEKVLPNEVESILLEMEQIDDCIVYAKQNPIMGQSVNADIVTTNEISNRDARRLIQKYCMNKLEAYKIPSSVKVVSKTNFGSRFKKIRLQRSD